MRSLPLSLAISAVAYSIAFALAAWLFHGFHADPLWLVLAVVIFMVLTVTLRRFLLSTVNRFVRGYTIIGGLLLTFVALWVTDLLVPRNGFNIEGGWTWAGVTALVWAAGVAFGGADTKAPAGTPGVAPKVG